MLSHGGRRSLNLAFIGTRGVPARYGGLETAVEEVGRRLVEMGHGVTVYCRHGDEGADEPDEHLGMELVHLPAIKRKTAETLSHSALSTLHALTRRKQPDMVFMFNAANSPLLPLLRARRIPAAVHVDGLEWRRAKWNGFGKQYYRLAESLTVRWADALIADAQGIVAYYRDEFDSSTSPLSYGAPILRDLPDDLLGTLSLTSGHFHVAVARFEPENNVDMLVRGYRASGAVLPLVVVGSAPYNDAYTRSIHDATADDPRILIVGAVWNQDLLNQLYAHAATYLHGHSIGGTNPSLLRAMGAGTCVLAYDSNFNREVLSEHGVFFDDEKTVAALVEAAEAEPGEHRSRGLALQQRAASTYRWDDVATGYEQLALDVAAGASRRGEASGRRNRTSTWHGELLAVPAQQ